LPEKAQDGNLFLRQDQHPKISIKLYVRQNRQRVATWLDQSKLLVRNPRKPKKIATKPPRSSATPNAMRRPDGGSGDGRKLGSTKRVVSVGCFGEGVSMSSDLRALTRIRLQRAIYFCLHRDSLLETTAEGQLRFGAENFRKKPDVI
jgi:hypothetical protein